MSIYVAAGDCLQARERGTQVMRPCSDKFQTYSRNINSDSSSTCHMRPLPIPPRSHKRDSEQYVTLAQCLHILYASETRQGMCHGWECATLGLEADEKMMLGLGTVAWWWWWSWHQTSAAAAAHVVINRNIRGWRWTWIQSTWENDAIAWKNIQFVAFMLNQCAGLNISEKNKIKKLLNYCIIKFVMNLFLF